MTTSSSRFTGTTNLSLLDRTQEYLKSLLEQQAPDTLLEESWDVFYSVYNRLIRRFIVARGISHNDVDDCLQNVWKEVATRLVSFEHPRNRPGLRAWLYTLVRSRATDIVRRRSRQGIVGIGDETAVRIDPGSGEPDPAGACDQQWDEAMLHTLLEEIRGEVSDLNYKVLCLRFLESQSVSEVAATLGLKAEQVRYRQHRLLKKLRTRQALFMGKPLTDDS